MDYLRIFKKINWLRLYKVVAKEHGDNEQAAKAASTSLLMAKKGHECTKACKK